MGEREQVVEILRKAISPPFKAVMGRGDGVVVVDGRPGYIWCRKLGKTEMLMEAYNRGAPNIEDVIVLVQESRIEGVKGYEVIGVASSTSPGNYYPEVPPHAWTHEWRPGIGRDRVTVYPRAWGYLRAEPIATGSISVWVTPGWYYYDNLIRWYAGGYSPGFTGTINQLLYFDPSDESLHIQGITGTIYGIKPPFIASPPHCNYPIAMIEATGTFASITENMIDDIRLFMDPIEDCAETGTFTAHTHAADDGGQLDWDIIWLDAIHSHANAGEGGQLDWDNVWSDAVHSHQAAGEGGQLDHGLALTGLLDDDHTQYFLADCSRAFGGDPIPDGADTRSLGSVDAEWRNIYVGEAGRIYFRLNQSVDLYSSAAGVLKTNDNFHAARVFVGDGLVGSPSYSFQNDIDIGMYRIGVNDLGFTTNSTLAFELNAVQQALITNGTAAAPGLAFISDPDTGLYRIGANRLGFATDGTFAVEIDATQQVGIGGTPTKPFEVFGAGENRPVLVGSTDRYSLVTFTDDSGSADVGTDGGDVVLSPEQAIKVRINALGRVLINETANTFMALGLTINQGAYDDEILACKSTDVAHGITAQAETDTYGVFLKAAATAGGLKIIGLRDADADAFGALHLAGFLGEAAETGKTTGNYGVVRLEAAVKSNSSIAAVGADGNLVTIDNLGTTRFIFDAEGSGHADVNWVAFQDEDDLALIADMELELMLRESEAQTSRRHALERVGIIGKDSWHMENGKPRAMINFTKLSMLHHGALIQVAAKLETYEQALIALGIDPMMLIPN